MTVRGARASTSRPSSRRPTSGAADNPQAGGQSQPGLPSPTSAAADTGALTGASSPGSTSVDHVGTKIGAMELSEGHVKPEPGSLHEQPSFAARALRSGRILPGPGGSGKPSSGATPSREQQQLMHRLMVYMTSHLTIKERELRSLDKIDAEGVPPTTGDSPEESEAGMDTEDDEEEELEEEPRVKVEEVDEAEAEAEEVGEDEDEDEELNYLGEVQDEEEAVIMPSDQLKAAAKRVEAVDDTATSVDAARQKKPSSLFSRFVPKRSAASAARLFFRTDGTPPAPAPPPPPPPRQASMSTPVAPAAVYAAAAAAPASPAPGGPYERVAKSTIQVPSAPAQPSSSQAQSQPRYRRSNARSSMTYMDAPKPPTQQTMLGRIAGQRRSRKVTPGAELRGAAMPLSPATAAIGAAGAIRASGAAGAGGTQPPARALRLMAAAPRAVAPPSMDTDIQPPFYDRMRSRRHSGAAQPDELPTQAAPPPPRPPPAPPAQAGAPLLLRPSGPVDFFGAPIPPAPAASTRGGLRQLNAMQQVSLQQAALATSAIAAASIEPAPSGDGGMFNSYAVVSDEYDGAVPLGATPEGTAPAPPTSRAYGEEKMKERAAHKKKKVRKLTSQFGIAAERPPPEQEISEEQVEPSQENSLDNAPFDMVQPEMYFPEPEGVSGPSSSMAYSAWDMLERHDDDFEFSIQMPSARIEPASPPRGAAAKRRAKRTMDAGADGQPGIVVAGDAREAKKQRADEDDTGGRRLACPYFKHDPRKYQEERSCVGPGWRTVHRVKEHLYRCHALPIHCFRCHATFKADAALQEHMRADPPCAVAAARALPLDGFDAAQVKLLRSRKKTTKDPTEEDKWCEVYRILFPSDDPATMPNPYYEVRAATGDQDEPASSSASATAELGRYEAFLRKELPSRVRQELEARIAAATAPLLQLPGLEESLKHQLVDIVHDLQIELFQTYKTARTTESTSAPSSASPATAAASSPASQPPSSSETTVSSSSGGRGVNMKTPSDYVFVGAASLSPPATQALGAQYPDSSPENVFAGFDGLLFDFTVPEELPESYAVPPQPSGDFTAMDTGYDSFYPSAGGQASEDVHNWGPSATLL